MTQESKERLAASVGSFRLPRYNEIPTVGLYLEQTAKYISQILSPLEENCMTPSMISNYVKKKLIASPVKKQYGRDQIVYLFFVAVAKNVLSLDNLDRFIRLQERTYTTERAYNYFCDELENLLAYVFGLKESPDAVGTDSTDEKMMLRSAIIAFCHKIYLEKCFELRVDRPEEQGSGDD